MSTDHIALWKQSRLAPPVVTREALAKAYTSYVNEYLSVEVFAEHHGLTAEQATKLLALGKECQETNHPDH